MSQILVQVLLSEEKMSHFCWSAAALLLVGSGQCTPLSARHAISKLLGFVNS
jgi:hypothetical protein